VTPLIPLLIGAVVLGTLGSAVTSSDFERLATAVLVLVNTVINIWHYRHIRKEVEPKLEQTKAVVVRTLGERDPSQGTDYDGTERRSEN
jgi:hypothetical protein